MRRAPSFAIGLTLLLGLATPALADGDDVVLLANGGRVRGTVVVEDPTQGVRVRLADGTIRNIAAKDVKAVEYAGQAPPPAEAPPVVAAPAPPPSGMGIGSIHVETAVPATVLVDGGDIGKSPADVTAAAVGRHRVHVDFDDGGSAELIVLVQGGQTAKVSLDLPLSREIFQSHRGLHFGMGGEFTVIPFLGLDDVPMTFGAGVAGFLQYGLSPGADFRVSAFLDATGGSFGFVPLGGSLELHFNLGSVYTVGFGARGGVGILAGSNGSTPAPFFGPELSLIGFRFGDRRQFSVELTQRIGLYFFSGDRDAVEVNESLLVATFENAIGFTYLFLDADSAKAAPPSARAPEGP